MFATQRKSIAIAQWPIMIPVLAGLYMFLHPYKGLVHDSRIYTLQALNLLRPDLYAGDVYLKYGSQDNYTFFSPLYAGIISQLGAEHAASLITLLSTIALLGGAWLLARALATAKLAWLGVGLLVVIPGYYGPYEFFAVIEGFATPRLLAQSFVLIALASWLHGRLVICMTLLGASILMHPLMALPGALLPPTVWAISHWRRLWPLMIIVALLGVAALTGGLSLAQWQFDPHWWPLVGRESLLLLEKWTAADWGRAITCLITLGFAAQALSGGIQRVSIGLLAINAAALLLSWLGGDILKIVIVVQGQAWRALWLTTTLAALLLPAIVATCWKGSLVRRASVLLLILAWVLGHDSLALLFSIPAMVLMLTSATRAAQGAGRMAVFVATILLSVGVLCSLALLLMNSEAPGVGANSDLWLSYLRSISANGVLPLTVLLGFWYAGTRLQAPASRCLLFIAITLPAALVATAAVGPWINETYSTREHQAFSQWRDLIPQGRDVLWATSSVPGSDPSVVWHLLERPSYYSSVQVNSALFSRAAAIELQRRHASIPAAFPTEQHFKINYPNAPAPTCGDVPVRYIVTDVVIADAKTVQAPKSASPPFDKLQLRICP